MFIHIVVGGLFRVLDRLYVTRVLMAHAVAIHLMIGAQQQHHSGDPRRQYVLDRVCMRC